MRLILHWGGSRHGQVDYMPEHPLGSALLVDDGPRWVGVYVPCDPPKTQQTAKGPAEVWAARE